MMSKVMRRRWWLENISKNPLFENNYIYIYIYLQVKKWIFFPKSPVFKLAKNRIYSKGRKPPSPPPPSSQPSLQQKQSQLMCKAISKKEWAHLRRNLPCLYFDGCLKLMQVAQEITRELERKRKQFENHKSLNNFWTKMKKQCA
jgi:hypothetical protein